MKQHEITWQLQNNTRTTLAVVGQHETTWDTMTKHLPADMARLKDRLLVASLLLVAMPFVPSSFLLLVAMPGATNSVLATRDRKPLPHLQKLLLGQLGSSMLRDWWMGGWEQEETC